MTGRSVAGCEENIIQAKKKNHFIKFEPGVIKGRKGLTKGE
jgi:hypothetical protein